LESEEKTLIWFSLNEWSNDWKLKIE
jgi:hypothetical protein